MLLKNEEILFNRNLILSNSGELYTIYKNKYDYLNRDLKKTMSQDTIERAAINRTMKEIEHLTPYGFSDSDYYLMRYIIETKGQ